MKTGIVLVTYNDYELTQKFIDHVKNYQNIDQIVIVDNASTDDSYSKLKKNNSSKITILKNSSNKGYASGINLGSRYLIKEHNIENIIISNSDITIEKEQDIDSLIKVLNSQRLIGITAPVIRQHDGYDKGWKITKTWQDILLNLIYIHRFINRKFVGYPQKYYENKKKVLVERVSGCFFVIKAKALQKINFMDEGTFLYYEENILATKLKKQGYQTILLNDIQVFHDHSVMIDKSINRLRKYKILKQSQLYFEKNYNNASKFDIIMLQVTSKLTYLIYYFITWTKGEFKK